MSVAFDAVGPSSAGTAATAATSLTWSHTCTGTNRLLVVGVSVGIISSDATVTTTATYNGVSMTSAAKAKNNGADNGYVEIFYLVAPATGTNTVAITCNKSEDLIGGSISFTGVDQLSPVAGTQTGQSSGLSTLATVTITNAAGNMVVDAVSCGSGFLNSGNQTPQWLRAENSFSAGGNGAQSTSSSTGSVTSTYNISSDWWGMVAISIAQVSNIIPIAWTGTF